jgi:DNA-binding transcriptional regulator YiaG
MANISVVLRNLIRRVARKEIREDTSTTKKAILQYRRDIASLKRQICVQAKELSFLKAQEDKRLKQPAASAVPSAGRSEGLRFSARSVRAQRKRLGLTRRRFAKLVGVSPLTIFNWEHGQSRPRESSIHGPGGGPPPGTPRGLEEAGASGSPCGEGRRRSPEDCQTQTAVDISPVRRPAYSITAPKAFRRGG